MKSFILQGFRLILIPHFCGIYFYDKFFSIYNFAYLILCPWVDGVQNPLMNLIGINLRMLFNVRNDSFKI
jgi:hypothetical protein